MPTAQRPPDIALPLPVSVGDVYQDADDMLWVVTMVADPEYEADPERTVWSRFRDSIVEAIDPDSGEVIAARRFDAYVTGFTNRGEAIIYDEDAAGLPTLEVRALHLIR